MTGKDADAPRVTVVMTPRERFNMTERSYNSLREHTKMPFELVVVDSGSPDHVRDFLRKEADEHGFTLVRKEHFLAPNEARNVGAAHIGTEYAVFTDNDVLYTDGWLEKLVETADETQADIIAPLTCIGNPPHTTVHIAGGDIRFGKHGDQRTIYDSHRHMNRPLEKVRDRLVQEVVSFAEFHCMFVRSELLERTGPFDEKLKTTREHIDFCLTAQEIGAKIVFEPDSLVTYFAPPPIDESDIPFFVTRWNDEWGVQSMEHFMEKWDCWFNAENMRNNWIGKHRRKALEPQRERQQKLLGWRISHALMERRERTILKRSRAARKRAGLEG